MSWAREVQAGSASVRCFELVVNRGGQGAAQHIDAFRISHVQRSDGWIATTWNTMSDPGAFAVAGAEEQEGGELPPLAGAGVVVCLMA
jgi:hypothetical protein